MGFIKVDAIYTKKGFDKMRGRKNINILVFKYAIPL